MKVFFRGFGYSIRFEIAQMALSYYLNKLLKDFLNHCFLNHHGRTGPESACTSSRRHLQDS